MHGIQGSMCNKILMQQKIFSFYRLAICGVNLLLNTMIAVVVSNMKFSQ